MVLIGYGFIQTTSTAFMSQKAGQNHAWAWWQGFANHMKRGKIKEGQVEKHKRYTNRRLPSNVTANTLINFGKIINNKK
jgi:hypothetical protein